MSTAEVKLMLCNQGEKVSLLRTTAFLQGGWFLRILKKEYHVVQGVTTDLGMTRSYIREVMFTAKKLLQDA